MSTLIKPAGSLQVVVHDVVVPTSAPAPSKALARRAFAALRSCCGRPDEPVVADGVPLQPWQRGLAAPDAAPMGKEAPVAPPAATTSNPPIAFAVADATAAELADVSYEADPAVAGLYWFSMGYAARVTFVLLPEAVNTTPPPAMVDYTYLGTFGVVTSVGGINNWAVLVADTDQTAFRTASTPWASVARTSPSAVPPAKGRFHAYKSALDGLFVLRSADYYPASGFLTAVTDGAGSGFTNGVTATPTDPALVARFDITSFPAGAFLASTLTAAGAITTKFAYYITCPHASLNALDPSVIDFKQLQFSASAAATVVAATGYDYATQAWVLEATGTNTCTIRSAGNTANYLTATRGSVSGTEFEVLPHESFFGAYTIRSVAHGTGTIKTYLSVTPAGVVSWAAVVGTPTSANLALRLRMGETSFPRMVNY